MSTLPRAATHVSIASPHRRHAHFNAPEIHWIDVILDFAAEFP